MKEAEAVSDDYNLVTDLQRSKHTIIRAALVGAGNIARQHLACLRQLSNIEIVGICDLSRARAQYMAERFEISDAYTSFDRMIEHSRPDIVHVTTPPSSHFLLAKSALHAGVNVIVEKPAALNYADVEVLARIASEHGLFFIENHNYVFSRATRRIISAVKSGTFGDVIHVEAFLCLDIAKSGSPFNDPNAPHPLLDLPGGAIIDFLPHLASLSYAFVGPHRSSNAVWSKRSCSELKTDEFRALIQCENGTATLGFSSNTRPDAFWLRVYGTKMQAVANLFETRLTFSQLYSGPSALTPFHNSLKEARDVAQSAFGTLLRKVNGGPGSYDGLWHLLAKIYEALGCNDSPPVPIGQVLSVSRLVEDLTRAARQ